MRHIDFKECKDIKIEEVVGVAARMKADGHRLGTMTCVELDETNVDILYHYDKDLEMTHFRLTAPRDAAIPSISPVYFAALLVENEMRDQYGLTFEGLVLDFGQTLFLEKDVVTVPLVNKGALKKGK